MVKSLLISAACLYMMQQTPTPPPVATDSAMSAYAWVPNGLPQSADESDGINCEDYMPLGWNWTGTAHGQLGDTGSNYSPWILWPENTRTPLTNRPLPNLITAY